MHLHAQPDLAVLVPAHPEGVPEILDVAGYMRHVGLLPVHPEEQPRLHELGHRLHGPLRRLAAALHDDEVVGVADERVAAPLKLPVQLVEQDVGQKRRQRPALRGALAGLLHDAVHHDARHQEAVHERHHPLVHERVRQQLDQLGLVHGVEEPLQVHGGHPHVARVGVALDGAQRVVRRPAGTEAVAVRVEPRLEYGHQLLRDGLLDQPVDAGGDAEQPDLAPLLLGYLHPSHRLGPVLPPEYPVRERVVVVTQPRIQLRGLHAVHAARAPVPHDAVACDLHVLARADAFEQALGVTVLHCVEFVLFGAPCARRRLRVLSGFRPCPSRLALEVDSKLSAIVRAHGLPQ